MSRKTKLSSRWTPISSAPQRHYMAGAVVIERIRGQATCVYFESQEEAIRHYHEWHNDGRAVYLCLEPPVMDAGFFHHSEMAEE